MPLQDYQVLQRDHDGKARVTVADGHIVELETGGPYDIDGARGVYVGDIWVLAGQSNMEGCADLIDVETPSPLVHSFQSREEWGIAEEPLHWLSDSPRDVHFQLWGMPGKPAERPPHDPNRTKGAGLGLTFGKQVHEQTRVPIGLIPAAHGGTSMAQWDPALKELGGGSLYGATCERVKACGGKVAGILWYQGESDTGAAEVPLYRAKMKTLVEAFRRDFDQPDLPFYYVQLGRFAVLDDPATVNGWNAVREDQRLFVNDLPNLDVVAAIDLGLDDGIHIGTDGLKRLGRRLARVAIGHPAPALEAVTVESNPLRVRITYKNIEGGLKSQGLPTGFSFRTSDGLEALRPWKVILDGQSVVLCIDGERVPDGVNLWYGWGADPYCNITDAQDMAVPTFGPISLATE